MTRKPSWTTKAPPQIFHAPLPRTGFSKFYGEAWEYEKPTKVNHPFFEGPEIKIYFNRRPLGFKIKEGDNGLNAIIASIDDRTHDDRIIGTQITEINEFDCTNAPFDQITSRLQNSRLPLQIVFQRPPRVNVFPNSIETKSSTSPTKHLRAKHECSIPFYMRK